MSNGIYYEKLQRLTYDAFPLFLLRSSCNNCPGRDTCKYFVHDKEHIFVDMLPDTWYDMVCFYGTARENYKTTPRILQF